MSLRRVASCFVALGGLTHCSSGAFHDVKDASGLKADERILFGEVIAEGVPLSSYAIGMYVGADLAFDRALPDHALSAGEMESVGDSAGENIGKNGGTFIVAAPRSEGYLLGVRVFGYAVLRSVRFLAVPSKIAAGSARCTYVGSIVIRPAAGGMDVSIQDDLAGALKRSPSKFEGCESALAVLVNAAYHPGATAKAPEVEVPPVEVHDVPATYPVHGKSARELQAALHASGLTELSHGDAAAETNEQLSARYVCHKYADGFAVDKAAVHLEIKTTLPTWEERAAASPDLAGRWDRLLGALTKHEAGHRTIALEHAEALRTALKTLAPAASCDAALDAANALLQKAAGELDDAQHDYDKQTRHGITQGAVL